MFLLIHKRNTSCISVVKSHNITKQKNYSVTVLLIQCHSFENDSDRTVTVYLRHFQNLPDIFLSCNLIKATLKWTLLGPPLREVGTKFSLQLSLRTQFAKIKNKKVIAENQSEKHKK